MPRERIHEYRATCRWTGETKDGYTKYTRAHELGAPPAEARLEMSGDAAFLGDPRRLNPEQLLVMAAASCQLLSFLALAARAHVSVRKYEDEAEAKMPEIGAATRISEIRLRPRIELPRGPSEQTVLELVRQAHAECYVANSLNTEVTVEPTIVFV